MTSDDDDKTIDAAHEVAGYWRARKTTNISLVVFALTAVAAAVLEPHPHADPDRVDPMATAVGPAPGGFNPRAR
jgi:hypothetical protein